MKDKKTLVSIITVVFNGEKFIEETILSVLEQSYENIEYIVIDGGSTDGTLDIIKKYEHKIKYFISEKDNGMYDAINKGLKRATGDIINFINSDDTFYSNMTISHVVNAFKKDNLDCLYGGAVYIDGNGIQFSDKKPLRYNARYFKTLGMPCTQPSFFWKRTLMEDVGFLNLEYKIASDYDFIARLCLKANKVGRVKKYLSKFRVFGESFGDRNARLAMRESQQIKDNLPGKVFFMFYLTDRIKQKLNQFMGGAYV